MQYSKSWSTGSAHSRVGNDFSCTFCGDVESWLVASGRRDQVLKPSNNSRWNTQADDSLDLSKDWAGGSWSLEFFDKVYLNGVLVNGWYLDLS